MSLQFVSRSGSLQCLEASSVCKTRVCALDMKPGRGQRWGAKVTPSFPGSRDSQWCHSCAILIPAWFPGSRPLLSCLAQLALGLREGLESWRGQRCWQPSVHSLGALGIDCWATLGPKDI